MKTESITENTNKGEDSLQTSGTIPLLQNPFTINFSDIRKYFNTNFKTNLVLYDNEFNLIPTYSRDEFSRKVYSEDNLLLYKSLLKEKYDEEDTIEMYDDLKSTPLWFEGNRSAHEYGFIRSIDGTSGAVTDYNRYLIDNLMPIFLLLENSEEQIEFDSASHIEEIFNLISSPVFRDETYGGLFEFNSSSGEKDVKSNFYSILANLLIHKYKNELQRPSIDANAYDLANETMSLLINKMWDNDFLGFYNRSDEDWSISGASQRRKALDTNALGIIALINFWIENESMDMSSKFLTNATLLYEKLEDLWNPIYEAYIYAVSENWNLLALPSSNRIDLEANSLMMQACLKLFEATGNITYYNRAIQLYTTFETRMYDSSDNAYKTSIGTVVNNFKNLTSNLRLSEAYLKALDIYKSTVLDANFNTTVQNPDFIVDQDILNLTCDYAFEKEISHSNPLISFSGANTTRYNNITGASITYILYYPNNTIIEVNTTSIVKNTTNFLYPITESLPIEDGYSITIYANTTYFGIAIATKTFNITSGIVGHPIQGLEGIDLYQGRTVNITLPINNTRNDNITLDVSLEGFGIEDRTILNVNFTRYILTNISFNLTIKNDATPGIRNLSFKFKNGSILYLEVVEEITIVNALTYKNLIFNNKLVAGGHIQISMNLFNFYPNETKFFNVSFTGNYIIDARFPEILYENEIKTVYYQIFSPSNIPEDIIEIEMSISIGETIFYTESLLVEIIPKFEIVSIQFTEKVTQSVNPHIIIIIKNNQDSSEEFTLIINDEKVDTDLDELSPGENRIDYEIQRFNNPYELGTKTYTIEIEDESEEVIVKEQFEYELEISALNLIFFYLIPILVPIGVILYFKNKEIKNKLLRR